MFSSLDAATQLAGPNLQVLQLLLLHKPSQGGGELQRGGNRIKHQKCIYHHLCYSPVASYLSAVDREARVAAQPPLRVVGALSMPTQVDGSGLDVYVHQVIDDLTLDVILDPIDEKPPADVDHLDEGQIPERGEQKKLD